MLKFEINNVNIYLMNSISILIKPSSSICNIKCKYCFYLDESKNRTIENNGIMNERVMRKIIDKVIDSSYDNILFSFQGGEPTIAGLDYFKSFIDYLNFKNNNERRVNYSIQTNGLLIDNEWCNLFKYNDFLIGLSFDIMENIHNKYRTGINNKEHTYNKVLNTKLLLDKFEIKYNILTVLTSELSKFPKEVYKNIKILDIKYTQFIPCLSELYNDLEHSIKPKDFAYFYKEIFTLWKKDFLDGLYYSIQFFDNIIPLIGGFFTPMTCGINGICHNQIVIESNGDIFPCDFYCLDKYNIGNIVYDDLKYIYNNKKVRDFISENKYANNLCHSCKYFIFCNGGCKRMNKNMYIDGDFCGYKDFLDFSFNDILKIWEIISR